MRAPRPLRAATLLFAAWLASITLSSCSSGELPLEVVDPLAAPATPTYAQVKEILDRRCLTCHDRGEESESDDPDFSSCDGVLRGMDGLLRTAVFGGSMPPGALPRLTEREKLLIDRWVEQGACAPCNPCP